MVEVNTFLLLALGFYSIPIHKDSLTIVNIKMYLQRNCMIFLYF